MHLFAKVGPIRYSIEHVIDAHLLPFPHTHTHTYTPSFSLLNLDNLSALIDAIPILSICIAFSIHHIRYTSPPFLIDILHIRSGTKFRSLPAKRSFFRIVLRSLLADFLTRSVLVRNIIPSLIEFQPPPWFSPVHTLKLIQCTSPQSHLDIHPICSFSAS